MFSISVGLLKAAAVCESTTAAAAAAAMRADCCHSSRDVAEANAQVRVQQHAIDLQAICGGRFCMLH